MSTVVIDSAMTLEEALQGLEIPEDIRETLVLLDLPYVSFDGALHQGQLVLHQDLREDVAEVFSQLVQHRFPIKKMVPIAAYTWDDLVSMDDNNTSAFNYRFIYGTKRLSNHARGRAIDINPKLNPQISQNGLVLPESGVYDISQPGTILPDSSIVSLFLSQGWEWGGNWIDSKDWQHFQKIPTT